MARNNHLSNFLKQAQYLDAKEKNATNASPNHDASPVTRQVQGEIKTILWREFGCRANRHTRKTDDSCGRSRIRPSSHLQRRQSYAYETTKLVTRFAYLDKLELFDKLFPKAQTRRNAS